MIEKLLSGLDRIEEMSLEELKKWENLLPIIRGIGLFGEVSKLYGRDEVYVNSDEEGLWQVPAQLAKTLAYLSDFKIGKMVEIGTYQGWTCAVMTCYLRKFNPALSTLTVDPCFHFTHYEEILARLPIHYIHTTSQTLEHSRFDLAFIDGDHAYRKVMEDYEYVGKKSPICLFHDINNRLCTEVDPEGSVARAWDEIKSSEPRAIYKEILDHTEGYEYMGFGIRINPTTSKRE